MKKLNKKGQVVMYVIFIVSSLFVILIAAFFAPMGVRFTSEMYVAGERIMNDANDTINEIQNETVRARLSGIVDEATSTTDTNINILSNLYQYGWILVIGLVGLIIFLWTRALVEVQTGRLV